jgi:hypothetical protein
MLDNNDKIFYQKIMSYLNIITDIYCKTGLQHRVHREGENIAALKVNR